MCSTAHLVVFLPTSLKRSTPKKFSEFRQILNNIEYWTIFWEIRNIEHSLNFWISITVIWKMSEETFQESWSENFPEFWQNFDRLLIWKIQRVRSLASRISTLWSSALWRVDFEVNPHVLVQPPSGALEEVHRVRAGDDHLPGWDLSNVIKIYQILAY